MRKAEKELNETEMGEAEVAMEVGNGITWANGQVSVGSWQRKVIGNDVLQMHMTEITTILIRA